MLRAGCPQELRIFLFGSNLVGLSKKSVGLRPIVIGYLCRKLTQNVSTSTQQVRTEGESYRNCRPGGWRIEKSDEDNLVIGNDSGGS